MAGLFATIKQIENSDTVASLKKGTQRQDQINQILPKLRLDSSWKLCANVCKLPLIGLAVTPRLLKPVLHHGILTLSSDAQNLLERS
ncbi:hypothetical protein PtB15_18B250 [Puccinia triticina]|nr:hypothetical protein PtB15_18B250 [Puccinia triticina]